MVHTKFPDVSLPFQPPCLSSSQTCKKQRDGVEKVRQDSFRGLGLRMGEECRKDPQREWNHEGNIDNDEEAPPMSNVLQHGLPLLQVTQNEFTLDSRVEGKCTPTDAYLGVLDTRSATKPTPKPSKFHADVLRIGAWQWTSRYNGDLVAKFYYANHKLVWEILNNGLKRKIETDWENISALKVTCPESGPGTLEIMLSQRPRFSKEIDQQPGKSTTWLRTIDFTGGQASKHRRHVLQCAPWILNKHIVILLSNNHRLFSLSKENTQLNPSFENWHSEYKVPESSNAQDLYHHYDYQKSMGTNVVVGKHNGPQDGMPTLTPSSDPGHSTVVTGAPSGVLQKHREMFNWSNSALQTHTQNPYFEQWHSGADVPESSNTQDLYHSYDYHKFVGQQFSKQVSMSIGTNSVGRNHGSQDSMPIHIPSLGAGPSSVVIGAPSGGLQQQHGNMLNWSNSSLETPHQTPPEMSSAPSGDLRQHRNMTNRSNASSQTSHQTQANISSGRRTIVNPRKRRNLLTSMGASADSQVRAEDVRKLVRTISSAKRPAAPSWEPNISGTQTFKKIDTVTLPRNYDDATTSAMALKKISDDLLGDIDDMEPEGMTEDPMVMSTVNSLSNLLQQGRPAPAIAQSSSQARYRYAAPPPTAAYVSAEPATHQVLGVGSSGVESGTGTGSGSCLLPLPPTLMEGMPQELEPMEDIDLELFSFLLWLWFADGEPGQSSTRLVTRES